MKTRLGKALSPLLRRLEQFETMYRSAPGEKATIIMFCVVVAHITAIIVSSLAILAAKYFGIHPRGSSVILQHSLVAFALDIAVFLLVAWQARRARESNGVLLFAATYFAMAMVPMASMTGIFASITWTILVIISVFATALMGPRLASIWLSFFLALLAAISLFPQNGIVPVRYFLGIGTTGVALTWREIVYMWGISIAPYIVTTWLLAYYMLKTHAREDDLQTEATIDGLTGILNRRGIDHDLEKLYEAAQNSDRIFALALLDLDHFKNINDQYGHPIGDKALVHVAQLISSSLRSRDLFGRYGGEEFLIVLPDCSESDAFEIVERLRRQVADLEIAVDDGQILKLTVSIGISAYSPVTGFSLHRILESADQALYRAKSAGRNQTVRALAPQ